jgi:surface antigen
MMTHMMQAKPRVLALALLLGALLPTDVRAESGLNVGTLVGAGLGGVIGNQIGKGTGNTVATVAGVILGGVAGHAVDRDWNGGAQSYRTSSYAAPVYQPQPTYYQPTYAAPTVIYQENDADDDWHERRHGRRHGHDHGRHEGWRQQAYPVWQQPVVLPVRQSYYPERDEAEPRNRPYCREYTHRVWVGNRVQDSFGTACLQPDGSWRVAN